MIGSLSIEELCARSDAPTKPTPKQMRRMMADAEKAGIVEPAGEDRWRLTQAAAEQFVFAFQAIRAGNVPLEAGDDDGLDHCKPGPAKVAAAA